MAADFVYDYMDSNRILLDEEFYILLHNTNPVLISNIFHIEFDEEEINYHLRDRSKKDYPDLFIYLLSEEATAYPMKNIKRKTSGLTNSINMQSCQSEQKIVISKIYAYTDTGKEIILDYELNDDEKIISVSINGNEFYPKDVVKKFIENERKAKR